MKKNICDAFREFALFLLLKKRGDVLLLVKLQASTFAPSNLFHFTNDIREEVPFYN